MKPVLVIGYGNPLRGDDGVGWELARRLESSAGHGLVSILTVQQLTPELAEAIHRAALVIFIDASVDGPAGGWKSQRVVPGAGHASPLGHHFAIEGLLAYARAVFGTCPEAHVISVTAKSFACAEEFSPEVEAALPAVLHLLLAQIAAFEAGQPSVYA